MHFGHDTWVLKMGLIEIGDTLKLSKKRVEHIVHENWVFEYALCKLELTIGQFSVRQVSENYGKITWIGLWIASAFTILDLASEQPEAG